MIFSVIRLPTYAGSPTVALYPHISHSQSALALCRDHSIRTLLHIRGARKDEKYVILKINFQNIKIKLRLLL